MMEAGCSPLGPGGVTPSPSSGAALVGMPLYFPFGGGFQCFAGGASGGFAGGPGVPGVANAFSSGGADVGRCGLGRLTFEGWILGDSTVVPTPFAGFVVNITVTGGGSVPANSGTTLSLTVPGALGTDSVHANQTSALFPAGMSIVNAFATGANAVTIEILNCTTSAKSIPSNFPLRVGILRG